MSSDLVQVRASGLSDLFDCPARWYAKNIEKRRMPTSSAAQLGTAVHAGAAAFDQGIIDKAFYTVDDTAAAVVDAIYHPAEDVDWTELPQKKAEKIALNLHAAYCKDVAPKQNYIAVEGECEPIELSDLGIKLTGTTDRIYCTEDGSMGIADLKTGKTAVNADGVCKTAGYAPQVGIYEILAANSLDAPLTAPAKIIGLQTGATAKSQRVAVGEIEGARALVLGTEERPGLLQSASQIIKSGVFYGNPRSMLCNPKFCPAYETCPFK